MKHLMINEALPIAELSRLGLYKGHKHLLSDDDLSALLSGRRTSIVKLENLVSDGFTIENLDAKLSLNKDEASLHEIRIHPIYKEPRLTIDLSTDEAKLLVDGELHNIAKSIKFPDGQERTIVFEYDRETKEFISYDHAELIVPFKINGEILSEKLQMDFAFGSIVELSDGTKVRYSVKEQKGIIANRSALIISNKDHGMPSGLLLERISPLSEAGIQLSPFTTGFESAFIELEKSVGQSADELVFLKSLEELKIEYSMGYSNGLSR